MKRVIIYFLLVLLTANKLYSQNHNFKISLSVFIDSIKVTYISRHILISDTSKSFIFSTNKGDDFFIDSSFSYTETINIDLVCGKYILRFNNIGNRLRNYDIIVYISTKNIPAANKSQLKAKYKYNLVFVPRLTKEMIENAVKTGTPYNTLRTKDYYVY